MSFNKLALQHITTMPPTQVIYILNVFTVEVVVVFTVSCRLSLCTENNYMNERHTLSIIEGLLCNLMQLIVEMTDDFEFP